jgi:hypothetical protein
VTKIIFIDVSRHMLKVEIVCLSDKDISVIFDVITDVTMTILSSCSSCYLLHAGFLLRLFFDPEDGGDIFLRNVG